MEQDPNFCEGKKNDYRCPICPGFKSAKMKEEQEIREDVV